MKRKRISPVLFLVLACAGLAFFGCEDDPSTIVTPQQPPETPPPSPTSGLLRVAQLTEDARTVDVVIDGVTVARNVGYPGVTGYRSFSEGEHRVQILRAGTTGAAMVETTVFVPGGGARTVAVVGNDPVDLVVVDDQITAGADVGRVRLFNAVPDFPANFDLGIVNGPLVVNDVPYSEASPYANLIPGSYALVLKRGGTEEELATISEMLPASSSTTVFAVGTLGRGDIRLIAARDDS